VLETINITSSTIIANGSYWFGDGSSYFTNLYPGLFVLVARNIDIDMFMVDGELGADNNGSVIGGSFVVGDYTCYYKKVLAVILTLPKSLI
jgi:hypothetical protein